MEFPSRQDFELLSKEQRIETIKALRLHYRIVEMAHNFGFNNSSSYYAWLKKQDIYEELCGKRELHKAELPTPERTMEKYQQERAMDMYRQERFMDMHRNEKTVESGPQAQVNASADTVSFKYNLSLNGSDAANLLRKIAAYIEDDAQLFTVEVAVTRNSAKHDE
ncbi:hypothetical protein [Paenibacillus sp. OSY-SE]|uniref:hypothetical protein n=1 Tax=Paenibacillus sp. OSY-SE TaxID=1196323 RepID=UPI0003043C42|nr:hypothetical protein [Paenibacillus sp. OSY-SE]